MNNDSRFNHLLTILSSEEQIAQRADQKALTLMSVLGVILVFFVVHMPNIPTNGWMIVLVAGYYVALLAALLSLLLVIMPRVMQRATDATPDDPAAPNPIFFAGIARFRTSRDYAERLRNVLDDPEHRFQTFAESVYGMAQINVRKQRHLRRGMTAFAIAICGELAIVLTVYLQSLLH